MAPGTSAGKGRLREEIELLRNEVAELERVYRKGGPTVAKDDSVDAGSKDGSGLTRYPKDDRQRTAANSFDRFSLPHLFKEAAVAFVALLAVMSIAILLPAPLEEVARPSASDYVPRPDWYFLSLFQLLRYLPGSVETVVVVALPVLVVGFLMLLPFVDRNPARQPRKRPIATIGMSGAMALIVVLTVLAATEKTLGQTAIAGPPAPKPAPIGSVVYTKNCYNCHGLNFRPQAEEAQIGEVVGEGRIQKGMPAFGGVLTAEEIQSVSDYVRSSQGAKLFAGFCAGCHGSGVDTSKSANDLAAYVSQGNAATGMPAYGRMLTAADVYAISGYISSGEGKGSILPDRPAAAGSALYLEHCAGCHGAKGGQIPKADLGSKAFRDQHDEATLRAIIARGTAGGMPGFAKGKGGNLSEAEVAELARFLRFWEGMDVR